MTSSRQLPRRHTPARPAGARAFTLVELLVGATLAAAMMAAVLSSYVFIGRSLARLANQQVLQTEARRTLDYFSADTRVAQDLYGTPTATSVALTVPTPTGSNVVTYHYNNGASDAVVAVNGTNVTMAANTLTRCVYDGSAVSSLILLRNITTGGLTVSYYDASGRAYTTYTNYRSGIKQLALQFSTQLGVAASGTQTAVYQVASSRMILRNKPVFQ